MTKSTLEQFQEAAREILERQFNPDCEYGISCMQEHFEVDIKNALQALTAAAISLVEASTPNFTQSSPGSTTLIRSEAEDAYYTSKAELKEQTQ